MSSNLPAAVRWSALCVGVWAAFATACAGSDADDDENPKAKQERARFGNLSRFGRDVRDFDLNRDSEPDQWRIADGGRVVREERDLNFDGLPDMYIHYMPSGEKLEEEMDLDVDGKIDVVNHYRSGKLARKELAVDFRGRASVVKYYEVSGALSRIERDSNEDGRVDIWEYYEDDKIVQVGRDLDGDGTPDAFDESED